MEFVAAFILVTILFTASTQAICPLCTVAVGAGLGLSRWLGIDDTVSGLWIGALLASLVLWTNDWLEKKDKKFKGRGLVILLIYVLFLFVPLYWAGIIGHPFNQIWGMDKIIFGSFIGAVAFFVGVSWYLKLKEKNGGHAHFPFQKIVMPIFPIIILSAVFYFITKY